jgi:hypothetical protein
MVCIFVNTQEHRETLAITILRFATNTRILYYSCIRGNHAPGERGAKHRNITRLARDSPSRATYPGNSVATTFATESQK